METQRERLPSAGNNAPAAPPHRPRQFTIRLLLAAMLVTSLAMSVIASIAPLFGTSAAAIITALSAVVACVGACIFGNGMLPLAVFAIERASFAMPGRSRVAPSAASRTCGPASPNIYLLMVAGGLAAQVPFMLLAPRAIPILAAALGVFVVPIGLFVVGMVVVIRTMQAVAAAAGWIERLRTGGELRQVAEDHPDGTDHHGAAEPSSQSRSSFHGEHTW
ncbi:MAG: hypothetical protein ACOY3P_21220 [Planctomycetota bacterium]